MHKKLVYLSLFGAISFILMFTLSFPILPSASYLRFEPSEVPAILAAFLFGPKAGVAVILIKDILYLLLRASDPFGPLADFIAASTFVYTTAWLCRADYSTFRFILAGLGGVLARVMIMIPVNLVILQLEFGMPFSQIIGIMLPALVPFNLLKGIINAAISFWLIKLIFSKIVPSHKYFGLDK